MNRIIRILICDDEDDDVEAIRRELVDSGLHVELYRVSTEPEFVQALESFNPDLVLSDYVLSDFSGMGAMEIAHRIFPNMPFIFVSHLIHENSVIETLEQGATDYVFKDQLSRLRLSVRRALREVDEQKALDAAHDEIQRSEEHFRSLIENSSDIILVLEESGEISYASPSTKRILGFDPSQLIGTRILDHVYQADSANVAFMYSGKPKEPDVFIEFRFRRDDGVWRSLQAYWKTIQDEHGFHRAVVNAWDITDRIREQEALRESIVRHLKDQTELKLAQEQIIARERLGAIGQMASGIAHDFSNALMPILGFCEILLNRPQNLDDKEKVKKYLEVINTSADDAMKIVARLREFYRKREKAEQLNLVNLNQVVEDTSALTQHKWKTEAQANNATITVNKELADLPNIVGNEAALREALTNIVLNAVDAMPNGGEISFRTVTDGDHVVLEVSDSGVGMDEETKKRCFEPFYTTKGKAGTGLGLSMVYGIIARHEGTIDIHSEMGKGTTFIIRLPVQGKEIALVRAPEQGPGSWRIDRSLHILVVDDEPMVLEVMDEYLRGDGHTVVTAIDGEDALKKFGKESFDLVMTDRAMPRLNGDQLAEKIKQINPSIPLIMVTGFGELMKAKGEHPKGVDYLVSKPAKLEGIRYAIYQTLRALAKKNK